LIELYDAVRKGGLAQIDSARLKQAQLAQISIDLSNQRTVLCEKIGSVLDIKPVEVTLSKLAASVSSPWAEELQARRDRLQPIAAEVHLLNGRVSSLLNYCRSYFQRILASGSGRSLPVMRYGPTGSQLDSGYSKLFVALG